MTGSWTSFPSYGQAGASFVSYRHTSFLKITPNKTTLSIIIKCGGLLLFQFCFCFCFFEGESLIAVLQDVMCSCSVFKLFRSILIVKLCLSAKFCIEGIVVNLNSFVLKINIFFHECYYSFFLLYNRQVFFVGFVLVVPKKVVWEMSLFH